MKIKIEILQYYSDKYIQKNLTQNRLLAPTPFFEDEISRLYFGSQNKSNVSMPAYVDINLEKLEIMNYHDLRIENYEKYHTKLEYGVIPTCVYKHPESCENRMFTSMFSNKYDPYNINFGLFKLNNEKNSVTFLNRHGEEEFDKHILLGSANKARDGETVFAFASQWVSSGDKKVPKSKIYLSNESLTSMILEPQDDEVALTRPVGFKLKNKNYIFFSARTRNGTYIQKAALRNGNRYDRITLDIDIDNYFNPSKERNIMYLYPFEYKYRTLFAFALNQSGYGGFGIGELNFEDH
jgi:hypothetical protein